MALAYFSTIMTQLLQIVDFVAVFFQYDKKLLKTKVGSHGKIHLKKKQIQHELKVWSPKRRQP